MYFDQPGGQNTEQALKIAKQEALERGIGHIVVASTRGETGLKAAQLLSDANLRLVVVTHSTGFRKAGEQEMPHAMRSKIEEQGGEVFTGPMIFHSLGSAIAEKRGGYSHQNLVADTLRIFCQGMKVAVECVAMAADGGMIPCEDVIAVAGTRRGADTVAIIQASPSKQFFGIKVREILAKPRDF
jgi:hypothetical protein